MAIKFQGLIKLGLKLHFFTIWATKNKDRAIFELQPTPVLFASNLQFSFASLDSMQ